MVSKTEDVGSIPTAPANNVVDKNSYLYFITSMSIDVERIMTWLESPEGVKAMKDYCDKIDEERRTHADFFETPLFRIHFAEIKQMLNEGEIVDSESMLYHPYKYQLPYREFMAVFNAVFGAHTPINGEVVGFPTETVNYEGVRFIVTHGQGAICSAELIK